MTKNPKRDLIQEASQLILFDILLEEAMSLAFEALAEETKRQSAYLVRCSKPSERGLSRSQDLAKDVGFQVVIEVVSTVATAVATELFVTTCQNPPSRARVPRIEMEVEKEAVLLEMDESIMV